MLTVCGHTRLTSVAPRPVKRSVVTVIPFLKPNLYVDLRFQSRSKTRQTFIVSQRTLPLFFSINFKFVASDQILKAFLMMRSTVFLGSLLEYLLIL